jgi:hypothetical protein
MTMPKYSVRVDDGRYGLGDFETCEAAVRCCKQQVDELLGKEIAARMKGGADPAGAADRLFAGTGTCDTPFIISTDKSCRFSAYDYAIVRCRELLGEMAAKPDRISTCIHLQPLERLIEARGVALGPAGESPHGGDDGLCSPVSCTFDGEDLRKKLGLAACVTYTEYDGRATGSEATFYCKACKRAITGLHPIWAPPGTPRVTFDSTSAFPSPKKPARSSASSALQIKSKRVQDCLTFAGFLNVSVLLLGMAALLVLRIIIAIKTGASRLASGYLFEEIMRNHPLPFVCLSASVPMQLALIVLQRKLERSTKPLMTWADVEREFGWNLIWAVPIALVSLVLYFPFLALSKIGRQAFAAKPSIQKPIGIMTSTGFSEMIPAGAVLPHTHSESFGNAADNQTAIEITIVQRDAMGSEKIVLAVIDNLPPRPKAKLSVIVTITVDPSRNLRLKATVPETAYIKEFGPFPLATRES